MMPPPMPKARIALWVATSAAIALCVRSLIWAPPPFPIAFAAILAYLTLCVSGVVFPNLGMFATPITRGPKGHHAIALTFDDGPDLTTTPQVLALLKAYDARGTFFVIGKKAEQHPELLRTIAEAGHEVALHGYSHSRLTAFWSFKATVRDIQRNQAVISEILGTKPILYRPPVGHITPRTAAAVELTSVELVTWTVRALDGLRGAMPAKVLKRVFRGLEDGAIVMLHDAAERGGSIPAGVHVLKEVLEELQHRNLHSVTLTELLSYDEVSSEPPR